MLVTQYSNYEGKDTEQSNPEAEEFNQETEGCSGKGICIAMKQSNSSLCEVCSELQHP